MRIPAPSSDMPLTRRVPEIRHDRSLRSTNRRSRDRRNHGSPESKPNSASQKSTTLLWKWSFSYQKVFSAHFRGLVVWFVHVSKSSHPCIDRTLSVRRSSCRASVRTSPRNLESFSVYQNVNPGIVEFTLFQKANQTQPLHNSTLKMKPFLAFFHNIPAHQSQCSNVCKTFRADIPLASLVTKKDGKTAFLQHFLSKCFLAHFRGFVAFVVLSFGLSKFQNLTVHVSIIRCQYEELSVHMPLKLLKLYGPYSPSVGVVV